MKNALNINMKWLNINEMVECKYQMFEYEYEMVECKYQFFKYENEMVECKCQLLNINMKYFKHNI